MGRYRIEFLDGTGSVIWVMQAVAGSRANAFLLVAAKYWPPDALTARVVGKDGRRGPLISRPVAKSGRRTAEREERPENGA